MEVAVRIHLFLALAACSGDDDKATAPADTAQPDIQTTPCEERTWYPDRDADGFGADEPVLACDAPPDHVNQAGDCDDDVAAAFPGSAPADDPAACLEDADDDDHGALLPTGTADPGTDCDDLEPSAFPGGVERFGDTIDQDCDGADWDAMFDDFELGGPNPAMFTPGGGARPDSDYVYVYDGLWSMVLDAETSLTSVTFDASGCGGLGVELTARGLLGSQPFDTFELEYWDGVAWAHAMTWIPESLWEWMPIRASLPADAAHPTAAVRWRVTGWGASWNFDDVTIRCVGPDVDGDGIPSTEDCDDADAWHQTDCGLCVDADADGFGTDCDLGGDCDDTAATVAPGTNDPVGDGVDQDCSGVDGPGFTDGFELGVRDPLLWRTWSPEVAPAWQVASEGVYGLGFAGNGVATTQPVDTTDCAGLGLRWTARRGPDAPELGDWLDVSYWDGASWVRWDMHQGTGTEDPAFVARGGPIADPAARHPGFAVRFSASPGYPWEDAFYVDNVALTCGPDADGDGAIDGEDCAPGDAVHWSDCGSCVDVDGDGWGLGCDLGPDCADLEPGQHPTAADPTVDGVDQDCDELDGPGLVDDFESGELSSAVWTTVTDAWSQSRKVGEGRYAAQLRGSLESVAFDTSACENGVTWTWLARPEGTEPDGVYFDYDDGTGWVALDGVVWVFGEPEDFRRRAGRIDDPLARHPLFRIRARAEWDTIEWAYLDDVRVGCAAADFDGDGVHGGRDCNDADPAHWTDCATCADADLDGYGADCNLGEDCDDVDPGRNPGATDPFGDGVDQDCDGLDQVALFDDFETGAPDPAVWDRIDAPYGYETETVYGGDYSLRLESGAVAQTVAFDLSSCSELFWSYVGRRGPYSPEGDLELSWSTGGAWILADRFAGEDGEDPEFALRSGVILDPAAPAETFRLRLENTSTWLPTLYNSFTLDDLVVTCGPVGDADADGAPDVGDCAPSDPEHQIDCYACVDVDDDGFGSACDLGEDCDDGDPGVHPGQTEQNDGIDADCDRIDGPSLSDDFEQTGALDPEVWDTVVDAVVISTEDTDGQYALSIDQGMSAETLPLDTTACPVVGYSVRVRPRAEVGEDLVVSFSDGAGGWVPFERLAPNGQYEAPMVHLQGTIADPRASYGSLRLRLEVDAPFGSIYSRPHLVDDLAFGCSIGDADGDGWLPGADCDDGDAEHHGDCTTCVDIDGDGFGVGCDFGVDCNDSAATVFPSAPDALGDGVDQDCSRWDGPGLYDDFDTSPFLSPVVWRDVVGSVQIWGFDSTSGSQAVQIEAGAVLDSQPIDASDCATVSLRFDALRDNPPFDDDMVVSFHDGEDWVVADRLRGAVPGFSGFETRATFLPPSARHDALRVRFAPGGGGLGGRYVVDGFELRCDVADADADGRPDTEDCDPADPLHFADCAVCVDADGDGRGLGCDSGTDCDDVDATVFVGATDPAGDGIDSDCSGVDGIGLSDGFEGDAWFEPFSNAVLSGAQAHTGAVSLELDVLDFAETRPFDASTCSTVSWSVWVKRGPAAPLTTDRFRLEWDDGTTRRVAHELFGTGTVGPWIEYQGAIPEAAGLPDVMFRLSVDSGYQEPFYVDDFAVACGDPDADADGWPDPVDCDDGDAQHQADCAVCVDVDGDGFGQRCDLGTDCDDGDADVAPGNADPAGDGVDGDCSGVDGTGLFDDFELPVIGPAWVPPLVGTAVSTSSDDPYAGARSLELGSQAELVSMPLDTSGCGEVWWWYHVGTPSESWEMSVVDRLVLSYADGQVADEVVGWIDDWTFRYGRFPDDAVEPALQVRLLADVPSLLDARWFVDDLTVVCDPPDDDFDGLPAGLDCDDADAAHWFDCGTCNDTDGDGFGPQCDLGGDCGPSDADVSPWAPDETVDTVDQSCDRVDGVAAADDFAMGIPDPGVWALVDGDARVEDLGWSCVGGESACGPALVLAGGGAELETRPIDTTGCPAVSWALVLRLGPEAPDADDAFELEWDAGSGWISVLRERGDGAVGDFRTLFGRIEDPAASTTDLRFRLTSTGSAEGLDAFWIDDLRFGCATP